MDDAVRSAFLRIGEVCDLLVDVCRMLNFRITGLEQQVAVLTPIQED